MRVCGQPTLLLRDSVELRAHYSDREVARTGFAVLVTLCIKRAYGMIARAKERLLLKIARLNTQLLLPSAQFQWSGYLQIVRNMRQRAGESAVAMQSYYDDPREYP